LLILFISFIVSRLSGARSVRIDLALLLLLAFPGFSPSAVKMPKKAALRPAQAAARGGLSSAEVSKGTEGLILNVLSSRDASARAGLEETNVKKLGKTWDELKSLGFDDDVITEVLQSCATISKEAALDWLCLNVDEQRLPRQFRSAYRPSEAAKGEVRTANLNHSNPAGC
jgi:hypothetical protein